MEAIKIHKTIQERASKTLVRDINIETIAVNQWVRQGDIYIRRIEKITGEKRLSFRQLAPGTSKGSRHIVSEKPTIFEGYTGKDIPDLQKGPQIESKERFEVTHPEHANYSLPSGCYQVTYQTDFVRQTRVRD
jgi:hypothetical protein